MSAPRRTGVTSLGTLAAFTAVFVAVHVLAPQWARSAGLDVWQFPDLVQKQREEQERSLQIEAEFDCLTQQIAAGEAIMSELIDGRVSLDEAVVQIEAVNRERPGFAESIRSQHPQGKTYHERLALFLLARVELRLKEEPSLRDEVLSRICTGR